MVAACWEFILNIIVEIYFLSIHAGVYIVEFEGMFIFSQHLNQNIIRDAKINLAPHLHLIP